MEEFPYYGLSWFFYLLVAVGFLLLSAYKTRNWSFSIRLPLLSFIAAMALTPGVTISGETWWSPAAIIMIFELDQNGLTSIWGSLLSIIAFWIIIMISAVVLRWQLKRRTASRNTEKISQPELREPD